MKDNFINNGFTKVFKIEIGDELIQLQKKIYDLTKKLIIEHKLELSLIEKLQLPFKKIPDQTEWSRLMNEINESSELKRLITSSSIKSKFQEIFKNPKLFTISTFRARFPDQKKVLYDWHQDEGTWYVSKNKYVQRKFPATLWFSINGFTKDNSIELVKYSHKGILFNHKYINGQGYFSANLNKNFIKNELITRIEGNPSEAIIFHPLTLHRSSLYQKTDFKPRYSVDIRYYDEGAKVDYKANYLFKLKKFYINLINR